MSETGQDPDLTPEREAAVADLLVARRPVPDASFRGALGRQLTQDDPGWGPRPERLWLWAGACGILGAVLVLAGALIGIG